MRRRLAAAWRQPVKSVYAAASKKMITPYDICLIGSGEKREQSVEHRQDERSRDAAGITEMRAS
jgi:hypothetical protein